MYRLFAALPVPEDLWDGLAALQDGLAGASWRPEENFHITLRFFGDLTHRQARDLDDLLGDIRCPPFEVALEGAGWFGRREPSAVWAQVRESDELSSLSARCEQAARRLGFEPDRRPFTPHVTLAYLHNAALEDTRRWVEAHHAYRSGPFTADRFHLYSSHSAKGRPSRYEAEADYVLE